MTTREQAAIAAMQGLMMWSGYPGPAKAVAENAVQHADALLAELARTETAPPAHQEGYVCSEDCVCDICRHDAIPFAAQMVRLCAERDQARQFCRELHAVQPFADTEVAAAIARWDAEGTP